MTQFTRTLKPNAEACEEPGCKEYAALYHFGRKLCWACSAKESAKIREEPVVYPDDGPYTAQD
jgi:hypothetical protein